MCFGLLALETEQIQTEICVRCRQNSLIMWKWLWLVSVLLC